MLNKRFVLLLGFMGKVRFDKTGGGINYQCMPPRPEYNRYYSANGGSGGRYDGFIAGVEYQTYKYQVFPAEAHDDNVPCALCHTSNRSMVTMIPAQINCPTGWEKEYKGIY